MLFDADFFHNPVYSLANDFGDGVIYYEHDNCNKDSWRYVEYALKQVLKDGIISTDFLTPMKIGAWSM